VNEPFEGSEGYSWYCIPQTVCVEEYMIQVTRCLSVTRLLSTCFTDPGFYTCSQFYSYAVILIPEQSVENDPGKKSLPPLLCQDGCLLLF
jgi:hypothetical protein